jgi:hypothetical protein
MPETGTFCYNLIKKNNDFVKWGLLRLGAQEERAQPDGRQETIRNYSTSKVHTVPYTRKWAQLQENCLIISNSARLCGRDMFLLC